MDGINKQIQELRRTYKEKKEIYDKLVRQISIYSEDVELAELGFYEPHFNFEDSEQFKNKIKSIRDEQKLMLRIKPTLAQYIVQPNGLLKALEQRVKK